MADSKSRPPDDKTILKSHSDLENASNENEHTPSKAFVPYLIIADGPRQGTRFQLKEGENPIGRSVSSVAMLEDASVSRNHAILTRSQNTWSVRDAGSKNGTFVNGQRVKDPVNIGHGDIVQVGIYALRLISKPTSTEEEMAPLPDVAEGKTTMVGLGTEPKPTEPSGETSTIAQPKEKVSSDEAKTTDFGDVGGTAEIQAAKPREVTGTVNISEPKELPEKKINPIIVYSGMALAVIIVGVAGAFTYWKYLRPTKFIKQPPPPVTEQQVTQPSAPTAPAQPKTIPVFLDFASSPLPAKISMEGKDYGLAPVKVSVQLEPGKTYSASGVFNLEELQDTRKVDVTFTVAPDSTNIPIFFKGQIGVLKISNLPRDTQLYFEAYYAEDPFKAHTAKIANIVFGKPVYVPFGKYIIEVRQPKQIGDSNQFIEDIRYRREVQIAENNPVFEISVNDDELQKFPVEIRSIPDKADVFIDSNLVGQTPFKGTFPLGEHALALRKDGYFEHTQTLKMDINTPYQLEVHLKTTAAGEFINAGNALILKGLYKDAISQFSEVFKNSPTARETSQTQYLLGVCYLNLNDQATALGYFEQARQTPDFQYPAMLGLASIYGAQKDIAHALPLLVEVMIKAQDEQVKKDANAVFKQISPLRSVMYIYTDPPDASVIVNDKPIEQKTPLILHDLGLGNYKIRIQKDGFAPQDLNINMSIAEFNPVIIKLKPLSE